jgi:hypothetical protein
VGAWRTVSRTLLAVLVGDLVRRAAFTLVLGYPLAPVATTVAVGLAALSGLVAGAALALARDRDVAAALALAFLASLADRGLVVGAEVAGGATLSEMSLRRLLLEWAVDAGGLAALVALARGDTATDRNPEARPATLGYALFSLARLGPARPDLYFLIDVLGALSTFQRLRSWKPGID